MTKSPKVLVPLSPKEELLIGHCATTVSFGGWTSSPGNVLHMAQFVRTVAGMAPEAYKDAVVADRDMP